MTNYKSREKTFSKEEKVRENCEPKIEKRSCPMNIMEKQQEDL